MWKSFYKSKWLLPLIVSVLFVGLLSLRLLSDPDLGFHLNSGRWIMEHFSFPSKDTFTFSATHNDYTDLQWLFQVIIFLCFKVTGYAGLCILTACLSLALFFILLKRNFSLGIPLYLSCILLPAAFLIIEARIVLRPEMFTFIFITTALLILDNYYHSGKKQLYLLAVLMLVWCNIHSLFILGFALTGSYFVSLLIRDRKVDLYFLLWMCLSFAVCLINPYFIRGFTFPLELFTRFDSNNIYHQYIKEFRSFFHIDFTSVKDILFILFSVFSIFLALITIRKRKAHELILMLIFLYLALISIRNIPLFVIIAFPITGASLKQFTEMMKKRKKFTDTKWIRRVVFCMLLIIPVVLSFRLFTNSWYLSNESYFKTGMGIDEFQQPEKAATFMTDHKLNGKILNSIGFGGWLGWRTMQPVFIDGRLEVMKEDLYNEVVNSWNGGLVNLLSKYDPKFIVYNYQKYYTWTSQIAAMPQWKLIYLDGNAAIFMKKDTTINMPEINFVTLPLKFGLNESTDDQKKMQTLNLVPNGKFLTWMEGFYKKVKYENRSLLNIASFCLELKQYTTAERFFLEVLKRSEGREVSVYYALSEIYKNTGDTEKEQACLQKIMLSDKKNQYAISSMQDLKSGAGVDAAKSIPDGSKETRAKQFFNSGNSKYRNGDIEGALIAYDSAIALNPGHFKAYNNRAIIKANDLKKDKEALEDFDKAIALNADYPEALLGRGTSKYNLKDYTGACNDWSKAAGLGNLEAGKEMEKYCK